MNAYQAIIQKLTTPVIMEARKAVVIGIAGAGCLGKTTLAHNIAAQMGGTQCQVISLDGYLLEREARKELTGYDPRSYELDQAAMDLRRLLNQKQGFFLSQYNRRTNLRDISEWIQFRPFIVVEGSLALFPRLRCNMDLCIFVHATCKIQYQLRLRRERREFGCTAEQIGFRFNKYYEDYQKFIEPQLFNAEIVLTVDERYEIGPYCP